jgi:hypothetical protein
LSRRLGLSRLLGSGRMTGIDKGRGSLPFGRCACWGYSRVWTRLSSWGSWQRWKNILFPISRIQTRGRLWMLSRLR